MQGRLLRVTSSLARRSGLKRRLAPLPYVTGFAMRITFVISGCNTLYWPCGADAAAATGHHISVPQQAAPTSSVGTRQTIAVILRCKAVQQSGGAGAAAADGHHVGEPQQADAISPSLSSDLAMRTVIVESAARCSSSLAGAGAATANERQVGEAHELIQCLTSLCSVRGFDMRTIIVSLCCKAVQQSGGAGATAADGPQADGL